MTQAEGDPVVRRAVGADEARRAARSWWDDQAAGYQAEHGGFLADRLVWGPEGLDEADARLLGELAGRRVLEVGAGAAQCSGWVAAQGGLAVALDLSAEQLRHGLGRGVPLVQADAGALPFADSVFDIAFASYGALQFVADSAAMVQEVARVLRPGGRWVCSFSHPVRWCFPDDPGPEGLVARTSYWDRRAYVEQRADGQASYVGRIAPSATASASSSPLGWWSRTSSSPSGPPARTGSGAAGARCAGGCCPGRRSLSRVDLPSVVVSW